MRHRFTVAEEDRLDRLLAQHTPLSRQRARRAIEQGGVRVDGAAVDGPWHRVQPGAVVEVRTVPAPDRAPELPERYRDRWLLVVEKPAGLPSQPTREGGRLHVQGILSGRERYVGLHHRLDTPASGLLLLTLDPAANAGVAAGFQGHAIRRLYLAAVLGDPGERGTWDAPLDGGPALSRWQRLGQGAGASVLLVSLETGRTHQIRRHAADAGHPLLGDRRYGGAAGRAADRLALHAAGLDLVHPVLGTPLSVRAGIPSDLDEVLGAAGLPGDWSARLGAATGEAEPASGNPGSRQEGEGGSSSPSGVIPGDRPAARRRRR